MRLLYVVVSSCHASGLDIDSCDMAWHGVDWKIPNWPNSTERSLTHTVLWVLISRGGWESGTTTGYTIFDYSFINQMYILFIQVLQLIVVWRINL